MISSLPILDVAVALVADYACETGENPIWHPFERKRTGATFREDASSVSIQAQAPMNRVMRGEPLVGSRFRQMALFCCSWTEEPLLSGRTGR
jgi:hypothetical protein